MAAQHWGTWHQTNEFEAFRAAVHARDRRHVARAELEGPVALPASSCRSQDGVASRLHKYGFDPRQVDRDWLDASGFARYAEDAGLTLTWAPIARVATLEHEGWLVVYEEDQTVGTKRKLQRRDTILMAKKA